MRLIVQAYAGAASGAFLVKVAAAVRGATATMTRGSRPVAWQILTALRHVRTGSQESSRGLQLRERRSVSLVLCNCRAKEACAIVDAHESLQTGL